MSKILLVDDDLQVNEVIKATLEVLGHSVVSVDDPLKVAEAFATFQPDVTLVDYMLPGCSGLDVLKELGDADPHSIRYLATGMADFKLLQKALAAGACSLLSKPYRITDLMTLLDLAGLLDAALHAENGRAGTESCLRFMGTSAEEDTTGVLLRIAAFALSQNADNDVATRQLPLAAGALIHNARTHGCPDAASSYSVELENCDSTFRLQVADEGPGFDWQKAIARARSCMEKPCASGIQLILALADEVHYERGGRTACATIGKRRRSQT